MQNPGSDIAGIIKLMYCAVNPEVQKQTILKYFTPDASFKHPIYYVPSATGSVNSILGIYQWHRILAPSIPLNIDRVIYDEAQGQIFLEITQEFHVRFSPFKPATSHFIVHLSLVKEGESYYISCQEDFYHPEDLFSLLVPPLAPVVRLLLRAGTVASNINTSAAQFVWGLWRPASDVGPTTIPNGSTKNGSTKED